MKTKRSLISFTALGVCLVFLAIGGLMATEMPDYIELDKDVYQSNRKGPVPFEHLMHAEDYEVACNECHHVYEEGKNVWEEGDPVQKCGECHDPSETKGDVKKLRLAFHKNCKNCHKKLVKEGISDAAPYRKCNDCHEKK
jgi:hypothetical protein